MDVSQRPLTAALGGVILLCALLLRIFPDLETVFMMLPGWTITRPWQVLTAGYFEDSGLNLGAGLGALLVCAVLLQPSWGEQEFVKYVVLTNGLQGCFSWVAMISLYILFRSEHFLFARLGGLSGILGALAVAVKQHSLRRKSSLPLPTSLAQPGSPLPAAVETALAHAPTLVLVHTFLILLTTHAGPPDELLFAINGLLVGWLYLRYYQPRGSDGGCGDASAEFALAALFPRPLQPPLRVLGQASFLVLSSTGAFPPAGWGGAEGMGGAALLGASEAWGGGASTGLMSSTPLPSTPLPPVASVTTSDPEVAERRRERARALIEARLAAKGGGGDAGDTPQSAVGDESRTATPMPGSSMTPATPTTAELVQRATGGP